PLVAELACRRAELVQARFSARDYRDTIDVSDRLWIAEPRQLRNKKTGIRSAGASSVVQVNVAATEVSGRSWIKGRASRSLCAVKKVPHALIERNRIWKPSRSGQGRIYRRFERQRRNKGLVAGGKNVAQTFGVHKEEGL